MKIFLSFLFAFSIATPAFADRSAAQSGEIAMEKDASKTDEYATSQDGALALLELIGTRVDQLKTGGNAETIATPSDSVLSYLGAAYLYCSISDGVCPSILDALLEADLMSSKAAGHAQCPILTQFWRLYLRSDMEQRHNHLVRTGYLTVTDEFKKKERPKYIRCTDTIAPLLQERDSSAALFKARYGSDSKIPESVHRAARIVTELKERVPNLYNAVGAR